MGECRGISEQCPVAICSTLLCLVPTLSLNPPSFFKACQTSSGLQLASFGFAPDSGWMPYVQLYVTYDKYSYSHDWFSGQTNNITATGIFPSIKLGKFLLIGYGYLFGRHEWSRWTLQDSVSFKGAYSRWSFLLAADIDVYIYQGFYFTFGVYTKLPTNYIALGVSKMF